MALSGWVLDKCAAVRGNDPVVIRQLAELTGTLYVCPVGELEQLYSARSARDDDVQREDLHNSYEIVTTPPDLFERALRLQRDLAHHHGMWHRMPIPDLLIAETALHHDLGVKRRRRLCAHRRGASTRGAPTRLRDRRRGRTIIVASC